MPEVSVVIPTLNEEKYIGKILKHLLNQTFDDFEVIVADSSSKDKTREVVKLYIPKFKNRKTNLKLLKAKIGVSAGRNVGAKTTQGKYIYFLDADVYPNKNFIKNTIKEFKQRNLSIASCYSQSDDNKKRNKTFFFLINTVMRIFQYTPKPVGPGYCIISSKLSFKKIGGFRENIVLSEDNNFIQDGRNLNLRFRIINSEKIRVSTRRLEKEGTATVFAKYVISAIYVLLTGHHVRKDSKFSKIIRYPMGKLGYYK